MKSALGLEPYTIWLQSPPSSGLSLVHPSGPSEPPSLLTFHPSPPHHHVLPSLLMVSGGEGFPRGFHFCLFRTLWRLGADFIPTTGATLAQDPSACPAQSHHPRQDASLSSPATCGTPFIGPCWDHRCKHSFLTLSEHMFYGGRRGEVGTQDAWSSRRLINWALVSGHVVTAVCTLIGSCYVPDLLRDGHPRLLSIPHILPRSEFVGIPI